MTCKDTCVCKFCGYEWDSNAIEQFDSRMDDLIRENKELKAKIRGMELILSTPIKDIPGLLSSETFNGSWIEEWLLTGKKEKE